MRLLAVALGLLGGLLACDAGSGGYEAPEVSVELETDLDADTLVDSDPPTLSHSMGTQVGSEGFWGCPIDDIEVILDGQAVLAELGGSPSALVAERTGSWSLDIADEGGSAAVPGALSLADEGVYLWLDVDDGPGCADHLAAAVTGTLTRDQGPVQVLAGLMAIQQAGSRILLTDQGELADLAGVWGAPSYADPSGVTFRLDGDIDASELLGRASYVDCDVNEVVCPTADLLAEVDGVR